MDATERDDFFIESKSNPFGYGTNYSINPEFGSGFQWTGNIHGDFTVSLTDIVFKKDVLVHGRLGATYVIILYIQGAGDEFYPYQNLSPNTLRCYEPMEEYKAIYHPHLPLKCITLEFSEDFVERYLMENYRGNNIDFPRFFREKSKFFIPDVNKAMHELYDSLSKKNPAAISIEAKIYEIITVLASHLEKDEIEEVTSRRVCESDLKAMEEVTHYLDEHFTFNVSLHLLAEIACMSESKMKKLFKNVYGMSVTEYVQRKRLSIAEHMLIQTDLPISKISVIVGYSNPSRLIELFRRYYGMTPTRYRE